MAPIHALPTESILNMLQNCDSLAEAAALSSTCKVIHAVFSSNLNSIIWNVGSREILAFKDALMTARATKIVIDHFHKGQLPADPFPLDSLSSKANKISIDELKLVFDWEHFVKCIENICLKDTGWGEECNWYIPEEFGSVTWYTWRERFHRSMYRVFLMGAVLCRVYQEPLMTSSAVLCRAYEESLMLLEEDTTHRPVLVKWALEHLLKYPIFNFEAYEDHDPIYGPLADVLVQESKIRAQREPTPENLVYLEEATPNELNRIHANKLYAETLECLFAFLCLSNYHSGRAIFDKMLKHDEGLNGDAPGLKRRVTVVFLGQFYPEEILMPGCAQNACQFRLMKRAIPQSSETTNAYSKNFPDILSDLHLVSGQPNTYGDDRPTPHPPLQIFQFISRKFLGLRFAEDAFCNGSHWDDSPHRMFVGALQCGEIYLEDDYTLLEGASLMFATPEEGEYKAYYA